MISVYQYSDYRKYLNDWIAERRQESRHFSIRNFARKAGFTSHSYVHMVISGKRTLAEEKAVKLATALKLDDKQTCFFLDLVAFTQAQTHQDRQHYYRRLTRHAKFRNTHQIERRQLEFFSRWYYAAIREMMTLPDFRGDPEWISRRLKDAVTPQEVSEALDKLVDLDLCSRDTAGRWHVVNKSIATSNDIASLAVAKYHEAMIARAANALLQDPSSERHISALTVSLSAKTFEKIKQRLNEFRQELRALLEDEEHPDEVCQINLQLIGLTRRCA